MSKVTVSELNDLLFALTSKVNDLVSANNALTVRLEEAHARIDAANSWFNKLRAATVEALTARPEPLPTPTKLPRITRSEFLRAVDDLRAEHNVGADVDFPAEIVKARAHALATMVANREAAAAA